MNTGVPVAGLVCDNAPACVNASRFVRGYSGHKKLLHFNCSCHVLNLASKDIDAALNAQLGGHGGDNFLTSHRFINRICPTRWWAKLKGYTRLVGSKEESDRLHRLDGGHPVYQRVLRYIEVTRRVHVVSRLLEGGSRTIGSTVTRTTKGSSRRLHVCITSFPVKQRPNAR